MSFPADGLPDQTEDDDNVEPIAFYLVATCGNCQGDVYYGLCVSTLTYRGRPAVSLDMVEQMTLHCQACGATNYTGDLDIYTEGGDDPDEPDDEPEDDPGEVGD